ncbi:MAG: hypothetical protein DWQ37_03055 [Planctomycetota bacterium]|nr:MAG: hypothetical protein DWQ37_03055 [Planctomycetota bacterium]
MNEMHSKFGTHRFADHLTSPPETSREEPRSYLPAKLKVDWQRVAGNAVDRAGACIAKYPAAALATALGVGVLAGWLIKRK